MYSILSKRWKRELLAETIHFDKTIKKVAYENYIAIQEQYLLYSGSYFLTSSNVNFKNFIQQNKIFPCYIYKDFN